MMGSSHIYDLSAAAPGGPGLMGPPTGSGACLMGAQRKAGRKRE
jgi:hypothetical protein